MPQINCACSAEAAETATAAVARVTAVALAFPSPLIQRAALPAYYCSPTHLTHRFVTAKKLAGNKQPLQVKAQLLF